MVKTFHDISVSESLKELNTSKKGLSNQEAKKRFERQGPNELVSEKKVTPLQIFFSQFKNIMVFMLLFATIVSFMIGELLDATVILVILVINAVLGFIQEYRAEKAMEALLSLAAPHAVVIREGKEREVFSRELVKGDIVVLNVGDRVPANIRLIESVGLKVDQAHLTGESISVEKVTEKLEKEVGVADRKNIVYMGSIVTYGKGVGVVCATGMETEIGQIAKEVQSTEREETPLQKEIAVLAKYLAIIVVILVTFVFLLGIIFNHEVSEMFLTSVSLAVAAVPEGLPAVITVTLAIGMQRMAKKNAVVRKLSAVQTLGNVTVICSDKTGTLTKNEMTVTKIFDGDKEYEVTGSGYEVKGEFLINGEKFNPSNLNLLFEVGALCNNAYINNDNGCCSVVGDPTEGSLLVLASKAGINYLDLKDDYKQLAEISFNSKRKRMSVVLKKKEENFVYTKGAPDMMLNLCTHYLNKGKIVKLTSSQRKKILEKNDELASQALRVLGLAYKPIDNNVSKFDESLEKDLVFLGLVGMIDPPRLEVKDAINLCKKAGIRVMMLTGDYIATARAVGLSIGLIDENDLSITSQELDKMSEEEFKKIVKTVNLFARISPENKLRIVNELKNKGEIVAVTGDGVNDAPALKSAHIGVAMGVTGTDVSKEASEMVLTDDNFSTIVKAVKEGRGIFDNIKKFIKFLLASNVDTINIISLSLILGLPLPYIPIHILWMNLITDGLPALALSVDPPAKEIMNKKPRNPKRSLIREIGLFIIIAGLVQAVSSITLFMISLNYEGYFIDGSELALAKARTMAISGAIIFELFFVFNCRDDDKGIWRIGFKDTFFSNKWLTAAFIGSMFLQFMFIYNPLFNLLFKTVPLNLAEIGLVFLFASGGLLIIPKWFHKDLNIGLKKASAQ
ncbi:MAG: calcium-translocating P-type ATPase, SERCA-type [Nanoarchaeota archaeon]|nr:calcium-translocating P-type ATPase, SERCA-type [Nanoarchaeota archaeon]